MGPYRKPVPANRTLLDGIWSDLMDLWHSSFEVSNKGTAGLGVFVQDQTSTVLTTPFLQTRAIVTLAADTVVNSRIINLVAGHSTIVGEVIELAINGSTLFMQSEVVSINVNAITLDQPVNRIYTVAGSVAFRSTKDLLVDGSVTPQVFSVLPLPGQSGDMVRIILEMRGGAGDDMDFTTFGSDAELTNGCVLRINNGDGTYTNLFNFKSNSDFFEQGYDHTFSLPRSGQTTQGFTARVTWGGQSKHGVVIRLDGAKNEALEIVIQDNLLATNNTRFHLTAQGHELQE